MSNNSTDKITCWRGTDGDLRPVKCICVNQFGYPNFCTDESDNLHQMFENTHFLKKEDAWFSIVQSVKAGVSLSKRAVKTTAEEYNKAKVEYEEALAEYDQVKHNEDNPFSSRM